MGGSHVTFMDKETLAEEPATDIVVRGEGEETLLELVKQFPNLPKLEDVKGHNFQERQPDYSDAKPTLYSKP